MVLILELELIRYPVNVASLGPKNDTQWSGTSNLSVPSGDAIPLTRANCLKVFTISVSSYSSNLWIKGAGVKFLYSFKKHSKHLVFWR